MPNPPLVLVADDEEPALKLVRRIMEREGFQVAEAHDGHAALAIANEQHFDLILTDVNMPGIDGFEVIKRLRDNEQTARVPVILVTAHATASTDVELGLGLGADDYLRKPFDPRELAARARAKIKAYRLEERLKRRTEELEALVHIGEELNESLELDALLTHILDATAREIPADNGALITYDRNLRPKRQRLLDTIPGAANPETVAIKILDQLQAVSNDGWGTAPSLEELFQYNYQSAAWATLFHHGRKIGVLALVHEEPEIYNDDHLRLLKSIAKQAALAIRNAQLHEELRDYAENLEEMVRQRTAELQDAQAGLIRSEKLASLGRLSAGIAHEINNPLQPLLTCLNMVVEDLTEDNPVDLELLQVAEQSVRRIRKITQELLTFAKEGDEEYQETQLNDLLKETSILTRKQLQHANIQLETDLQPLPFVYALADRLQQVFVNMTLNAIEAMPDGGVLRIGTQASGDFVVIFFEDTGTGITPENRERLFEPFFSTKGENGTGLGLSVSYGIIDSHGGTIQIETEMNKGTTFYIWIPITQQATISLPEDLSIFT